MTRLKDCGILVSIMCVCVCMNHVHTAVLSRKYIMCPGERMRDMLREHGSFETLEMQVKKWHKSSLGSSRSGGWYTKHVLSSQFHWSKCYACMIDGFCIDY